MNMNNVIGFAMLAVLLIPLGYVLAVDESGRLRAWVKVFLSFAFFLAYLVAACYLAGAS